MLPIPPAIHRFVLLREWVAVLHEALTAGPDPLHLALVFNLSHTTASRYAAIAQDLLDDQIEQATGQRPAQPRYPSDEPTDIPGPQPR